MGVEAVRRLVQSLRLISRDTFSPSLPMILTCRLAHPLLRARGCHLLGPWAKAGTQPWAVAWQVHHLRRRAGPLMDHGQVRRISCPLLTYEQSRAHAVCQSSYTGAAGVTFAAFFVALKAPFQLPSQTYQTLHSKMEPRCGLHR